MSNEAQITFTGNATADAEIRYTANGARDDRPAASAGRLGHRPARPVLRSGDQP